MLRQVFRLSIILTMMLSFSTGLASFCRCQPSDPCWPKEKEWQQLAKQLKGKLVQPTPVLAACKSNPKSKDCLAALQKVKNPFYLQSTPAGTESQGWLNAWNASVSTYAIEAANANDVQAGVEFAAKHNLRLVIKGAGHDYLGRSSAPNSLLIWTHHMRDITYDHSFVPQGCSKTHKAVQAVTVSAGNTWLDAYNVVTNIHGRYVQGGGCTTVGAAGGFTQGGGFGSFSRLYGTGAGGMLQAEVVLADGKKVIANQCQNPDLFWALRGGGGGTFGVVTKMTLLTHPLPKYTGKVMGTITAKNNQDYQMLIRYLLTFMRDKLLTPNWGEQLTFNKNNTVKVNLWSQEISLSDMKNDWKPLQDWLNSNKKKFSSNIKFIKWSPRYLWSKSYINKKFPHALQANTMPDAKKGQFWWSGNSVEVFAYFYTYQSWWLPVKLFDEKHIASATQLFFDASRLSPVVIHLNKGLSGASKEALKLSKQTSMNHTAYNAAGLIIMAAGSKDVFPGVKGLTPNLKKARQQVKAVNRAMNMFRKAAPHSGAYANEADYFEKNWQQAFWGENYDRLFKIKQKVDPNGLFYCHHCVGSELWNRHGMCRRKGT